MLELIVVAVSFFSFLGGGIWSETLLSERSSLKAAIRGGSYLIRGEVWISRDKESLRKNERNIGIAVLVMCLSGVTFSLIFFLA